MRRSLMGMPNACSPTDVRLPVVYEGRMHLSPRKAKSRDSFPLRGFLSQVMRAWAHADHCTHIYIQSSRFTNPAPTSDQSVADTTTRSGASRSMNKAVGSSAGVFIR